MSCVVSPANCPALSPRPRTPCVARGAEIFHADLDELFAAPPVQTVDVKRAKEWAQVARRRLTEPSGRWTMRCGRNGTESLRTIYDGSRARRLAVRAVGVRPGALAVVARIQVVRGDDGPPEPCDRPSALVHLGPPWLHEGHDSTPLVPTSPNRTRRTRSAVQHCVLMWPRDDACPTFRVAGGDGRQQHDGPLSGGVAGPRRSGRASGAGRASDPASLRIRRWRDTPRWSMSRE
jgi:hypothetical protein